MHIQPIKTRLMQPPKDDLYAVLEESVDAIPEDSILVITSKVVAIHQGRCLKRSTPDVFRQRVKDESEYYLPYRAGVYRLGIRYHAMLPNAGMDGANGGDYWMLLPEKLEEEVVTLREFLCRQYGVSRLGVIVTDSVVHPLRRGALGISLAHAGFCPVEDYAGGTDLFGRPVGYTVVNVVDAISAAAVLLMGESDQQTPLALVTDIPFVRFGDCADGYNGIGLPREAGMFRMMMTAPFWRRGGLAPARERPWTLIRHWLSGVVWRWRQWRKDAWRKDARRKDGG